jgi:hypothetical protein
MILRRCEFVGEQRVEGTRQNKSVVWGGGRQGTTAMSATDTVVFVYMGEGGETPPHNMVRLLVDPSVASIPANAFYQRTNLAEVELCEGLVEIGVGSFDYCDHSITKINIPTSLRRINNYAFRYSLRTPIRLHDGIESIGKFAFDGCIFTNFRVPPLITIISSCMLHTCISMFSLELHNIREIEGYAFSHCYCLRNVAIPPDAVFDENIFIGGVSTISDLQLLFGDSNARIIHELQHRFDGLPIHRIVYYQSYNQGVLQNLISAINMTSGQRRSLRSKQDLTGNQQDCLGMTPLHILTCSSVHNLEVYRLIVENYPTNLITEDRWGALPLLYAFWGAAPIEIIDFLLDRYQSLYPDQVFNWTLMAETMCRCDTPKECIEKLLCVQQMHFPEQSIDWNYLLDKFARPSNFYMSAMLFQQHMQFLYMCGMSSRVQALPFQVWRDFITNMIQTAAFQYSEDNLAILHRIQDQCTHFEDEVPKLKEISSILELALWKMKMNEKSHLDRATQSQKKIKTDDLSVRKQNRVTCGNLASSSKGLCRIGRYTQYSLNTKLGEVIKDTFWHFQ